MIASQAREAHKMSKEKPPNTKATRRLNANLPEKTYEEAERLALEHNWTITDVVRLGIGLLKIAYEAAREGHRLAVVDSKGRVLEKIFLPV
ncbi:MAG TPA: hypothetical protein VLE27_17145 [Thermoanaerobaculia bacterium]|nr:hypothetical protein [Thermoanaerobaculia bacterium]